MAGIVLDERAFVENVLENHILGSKPSETIGRVARYYYSMGYKKSDITGLLEDFMLRCDPSISIVKWWNVIEYHAKKADKYELIDIPGVKITDAEIETINRIAGVLQQRLMFTLLCLAKYGDAINPKNSGWVNRKDREIFSLANIQVVKKKQALMVNDLWRSGYIGFSRLVDNTNINVKIIDASGIEKILVSDFRNLGNQWMLHGGYDYMKCESCGVVIKKSGNRHKYCSFCSEEIDRQMATIRWRNSSATA